MQSEQSSIRILIVDDHDRLREGLSAYLSAFNEFTLIGEASDGDTAIELCHQLQPDVVLMDLSLPEMTGITTVEHIHHSNPLIKIIILTNFNDDPQLASALQAGAFCHLPKNVSATKLAKTIRTAMD